MIDFKNKTHDFIITQGLYLENSNNLEIWFDFDANQDHAQGEHQGNAQFINNCLVIRSGDKYRIFPEIKEELLINLKNKGGILVSVLPSGIASTIKFTSF